MIEDIRECIICRARFRDERELREHVCPGNGEERMMDRNDEFTDGYLDGRDPTSPEPSKNRSACYRHSFAVGRAELANRPIAASLSRQRAAMAESKDASA